MRSGVEQKCPFKGLLILGNIEDHQSTSVVHVDYKACKCYLVTFLIEPLYIDWMCGTVRIEEQTP